MYEEELYNACEAFFGRDELSYWQWLEIIYNLTQGRGIEVETIEWWQWWKWNKERNKREQKE